ncbi:SAP-like protein BP-73 [Rhynchospora pubera]|uniref:SAP-like protein BP-73 n=1 Tax=Rhynchospora pubera TaxID=906938 RepID=A0AAV8AUN0_9POAL|nr:SAP-like protein BP-73 [Rhynchospora pubera]KAJ4802453.1 SAP-like protein BP-73 [Rhynchospora pubera]
MSISGGAHLVSSNHLHVIPVKRSPSPAFSSRDVLLKNKWPLYFQPLARFPLSLCCKAGGSNDEWRKSSFPRNNYQGPPPPKRKFKNHQDHEDLLEASQMLSSQNGRSATSDDITPTKSGISAIKEEVIELIRRHLSLLQGTETRPVNRKRTYGLNATMQKQSKEDREAFQSLLKLLKASGANQKKPANTNGTSFEKTLECFEAALDAAYDSENIDENSDLEENVSDVLDAAPVSKTVFSHQSPVPAGKYEPIMRSDTQGGETQKLKVEEKSGSDSLFYESESKSEAEQSEGPQSEDKIMNLDRLKVSELREIAKSRGLKGYTKMKKAELVEQLSSS